MGAGKYKQGNIYTDKNRVSEMLGRTLKRSPQYRVPTSPPQYAKYPAPRGIRRPFAHFPRENRAGCQENEKPEGPRHQ